MKRIFLTLATLLAANGAFAHDLHCHSPETGYEANFKNIGPSGMTVDFTVDDQIWEEQPCFDANGDEEGYFCEIAAADDYSYRVFVGQSAEGWGGTITITEEGKDSYVPLVCD